MTNSLFKKIKYHWARTSSKRYIKYMRTNGVKIGENVIIREPQNIHIDLTRPSLITIGDNVVFHRNFSLYTHDFVSGVFLNKYHDFLPSSGKVSIGNNVRFGINCTVLKGVSIGDNCFIAAGSIVTKDIPANSIAGGYPAKVLCSLEDYYERRKKQCIEEALEYAQSIRERFNREPKFEDFWEEFPLFVDKTNIDQYPATIIQKQLGNHYQNWINAHKAYYNDISDFLKFKK